MKQKSLKNDISCVECQDLIEDYLILILDTDTRLLMATHLETCQQCKNEFGLAHIIDSALTELPAPEPSSDIFKKVAAHVRGHSDNKEWVQLTLFDDSPIPLPKPDSFSEATANVDTNPFDCKWRQLTLQFKVSA